MSDKTWIILSAALGGFNIASAAEVAFDAHRSSLWVVFFMASAALCFRSAWRLLHIYLESLVEFVMKRERLARTKELRP